jgi:hypothetical protein
MIRRDEMMTMPFICSFRNKNDDGVVGDTETALVMRLMEPHVDPSDVLLVPCLVGISGALLQEGVAELPINIERVGSG